MQDIKNLNGSRKMFSEVDEAKQTRDRTEASVKELMGKLDENKVLFEKSRKEEEAQYKIVSKQRESKKGARSEVPAMIERRNNARAQLNKLYPEMKKLREEFQKKDQEFRKYMNEKRKEQRERYKAEQDARREEDRLRKLEKEEETMNSLHADKFASIDQLVTYLRGRQAKPSDSKVEEEVVPMKAEEGEILIGKHARDLDDDVFGTKKTKGKKGKKSGGKKKAEKFVHDINLLQEFEKLKLDAPMDNGALDETIAQLEKKREELKKDKESQFAKYQERKAAALAKAAEDAKAAEEGKDEAKPEEKKEGDAPAAEAAKESEPAPAAAVEAAA